MLAGLIAVCALSADPQLAVTPLGVARPDGLLRVEVSATNVPAPGGGPVQIDAELIDGSRSLSTAAVTIDRIASLARPAVLVLPVPARAGGGLRVQVSASWPGPPGMPRRAMRGEAEVRTPASVLAAATAAIAELRRRGSDDALPWLRAEQIAEFVDGGADAASIGDMEACAGLLRAWLATGPPALRAGVNDLALRDPVDGSVQPWRLHLPAGDGPFPCALLLSPAGEGGKSRWAPWDARQTDAALAAGLAVVECYAAGDRRWDGVAARRAILALAEAARLGAVDPARGCAIGPATATGLPFPVRQPEAAAGNAWWRGAITAAQPVPPQRGWAAAPFTIVVGTAEHAAAVAANRRLAEAFRAAYAAHAHAVVGLLDDACDPALLAGRNLVLIGNPRSNRVLARLSPPLPFSWDHRRVSGPAGFAAMRADGPSIACTAQGPDGCDLLILDGAPPPWGAGLPLAGAALPMAVAPQGAPAAR